MKKEIVYSREMDVSIWETCKHLCCSIKGSYIR